MWDSDLPALSFLPAAICIDSYGASAGLHAESSAESGSGGWVAASPGNKRETPESQYLGKATQGKGISS